MWEKLEKEYDIHKGIYAKYIKRIIDVVIALIGFACISPFFFILCILVRLNLGSPIFFKQKRVGKDEKIFEMIKFRTMTDERDKNGQLLPDTERFTKFGNFLRNSSLDELPELINVVKGEMSLVGPRPLYPFYLPYYTKKESLRHSVRGGITGLAQINGRALLKWNDRFEKDFEYVSKITFLGDLKILWKTFIKVFKQADVGIPSVTEEGGLHIVRKIQRPEYIELSEYDPNIPKFVQGVKNE